MDDLLVDDCGEGGGAIMDDMLLDSPMDVPADELLGDDDANELGSGAASPPRQPPACPAAAAACPAALASCPAACPGDSVVVWVGVRAQREGRMRNSAHVRHRMCMRHPTDLYKTQPWHKSYMAELEHRAGLPPDDADADLPHQGHEEDWKVVGLARLSTPCRRHGGILSLKSKQHRICYSLWNQDRDTHYWDVADAVYFAPEEVKAAFVTQRGSASTPFQDDLCLLPLASVQTLASFPCRRPGLDAGPKAVSDVLQAWGCEAPSLCWLLPRQIARLTVRQQWEVLSYCMPLEHARHRQFDRRHRDRSFFT